MGHFTDYITKMSTGIDFDAERKECLRRIAQLRGRSLLVYAANTGADDPTLPISISPNDLPPFYDQLGGLTGDAVDVILETPGGSGEVAEQIVRSLHDRFASVAFIIIGTAKSAGTIMAMSGDEILMGHGAALGPIDAQIYFEGKRFSADALLKGFEKIKKEADENDRLNRAYTPILARISPGDLEEAENALDFAAELVKEWLQKYKFKTWVTHRKHDGAPVTDREKAARAEKIAGILCDHSKWKTHGKSLMIGDLREMGVDVTDYSENHELKDALEKYHALLCLQFQTGLVKVIETPNSQVLQNKQMVPIIGNGQATPVPQLGMPHPATSNPLNVNGKNGVLLKVECPGCKRPYDIQADFDELRPLRPGHVRFPANDVLKCSCGFECNLAAVRQSYENLSKRKIARS